MQWDIVVGEFLEVFEQSDLFYLLTSQFHIMLTNLCNLDPHFTFNI